MIPDTIQATHILQALAQIDRTGIPARQQSRRYDLFYNGKQYPPKLVVRIAQRLADGKSGPMAASVKETNDFLTKRGFTIVFKPAAMSPEEEPGMEQSEWVLQRLLDYRETHPDFYFLTRTNRKRDLLEAGQWLPGTDSLQVALTYHKKGSVANRWVGLQIDYSASGHPQAAFVVSFKRERRPGLLAFYQALLQRLAPQGMQAEKPDYFLLPYGEDVLAAMHLFLERDVPIFQAVLHEFDLKETLGIGPKRFSHKPGPVLQVQEDGPAYQQRRLAQLCWNTNGWVFPSGPAGKSDAPNSLASSAGFGLEEWLLDLDKTGSDGYHYGFLQPVNQEWPAHAGKQYTIRLYTLHAPTQQYYWIGELHTVEVIDKAKSKSVEQAYRKNGWLQAMGEQLRRLGLDPGPLVQRPKEIGGLFNLRFLPENVEVYPELVAFSIKEDMEVRDQHYAFLKTSRQMGAGMGFKFRASAPPRNMAETIIRKFEHRTVEHPYLHGKIQQGLYAWLKEQFGAAQVAYEQATGAGGSRIDLALRSGPAAFTFYEVKTYNSLLLCIRVAMGQLMEYAFFPQGRQAHRLVIVSYHRPEKSALQYLENIRQQTGLAVFYGCFDLESGVLEMGEASDEK